MNIGVDLLWVRPGNNGGTESYVRNLLKGFSGLKEDKLSFVLFVSRDNAESFSEFKPFFQMVECPVDTASFAKRVLWENLHLISSGKKYNIEFWFFPVYSRPLFMYGMRNATVIHDLQAIHFPFYFSKVRNLYFRLAWATDCRNSTIVVTISDFCKKDIEANYKYAVGKTEYIYNPILMTNQASDFGVVSEKYGITKGEYCYTVSSLAKHKNLLTLLKAIKVLRDQGIEQKLLITGVKVNASSEVLDYIKSNNLEDRVVYTGFISDEDRNALYDNCKVFLFPSVFEGFGMPPVEAMARGIPVLTTKTTSLYEVTKGLVDYVEDPYDEKEWARRIVRPIEGVDREVIRNVADCYSCERIAKEYYDLFMRYATVYSQ